MDLSPACERVRGVRADGVPPRLRDVHRLGDPPGRAGGRAAAAVRDQAGGGARTGPPAPGARRDPGGARVPARPVVADRAAAPLAAAAPAAVPAGAGTLPARPAARPRAGVRHRVRAVLA